MLSRRTVIDDRAVAWFERPAYGRTNRPALLLIPGLGMTWRSFRWLLTDLPYDRRILAVHPPGAYGSDVVADMTAAGQAAHLGRWLDRLDDAENVELLGHSYGGFVAARLAALRPRRVTALTLVSPAPDARWTRLSQHLLAFARGSVKEDWHTAPQAVVDYLRADPRVIAGFRADLGTSATDLMAGVTTPTLVVRGTDDQVCSTRWCADLAAARPHGRTAEIHRGAHGLPQDDPQTLARLLNPVPLPNPTRGTVDTATGRG